MAIKKYLQGGRDRWQVYVDVRSRKDRSLRIQRRVNGFESEASALAEEKRMIHEMARKLAELETKGVTWGEVIDRWVRFQRIYSSKNLALTTVEDYSSLLRNWTSEWVSRSAADIGRADARELFTFVESQGKSASFRKRLKNTINTIYLWGIEERLIGGVEKAPTDRLEIQKDREEKRPEILTVAEIRNLLRLAREQQHPWYPIWVVATLTGARSGELQAILKSDVEMVSRQDATSMESLPIEKRKYGFLRIRRNWNSRLKEIGPTKAGYWRTVPISSELYWFILNDLKIESKSIDDPLLPKLADWRLGFQATILRGFCQANSIPSIKFHTLRACFATQLIAAGIPATVVMKICGWKDMKTMQRYIRLAGIEEGGATEVLRFIPTDEAVMEKVVNIFDFKRR